MNSISRPTARLIGFPFGLGANQHAGLDLGPLALSRAIRARIDEFELTDQLHFALDPTLQLLDLPHPRPGSDQDEYQTIQHLEETAEACAILRDAVVESIRGDRFPIVLGGDHTAALGALAGLRQAWPNRRLGVVWIDNHGDVNTGYRGERFADPNRRGSTPSGHIHGMSLAAALGHGDPALTGVIPSGRFLDPGDVYMIGIRDLDPGEREFLRRHHLPACTSRQVEAHGIAEVIRQAVDHLAERGIELVHLSFDIDALDASLIPGTGTPVPGGLTFREADLAVKLLRDLLPSHHLDLAGFELVEVNPTMDIGRQTVEIGSRLACTLLGEEILPV